MSKVFRIKPTFCEHLLIVPRWKKPDWNYKNNARLFRFGFTVWFSSYPSALLHVVSIANFVASKISCSVFETGISFRFVVPTFESFLISASFSPVCRPLIYEQVRELGVKLRHVVHEDWLVSSLSLHVPNIWYLRKWIITSIVQNLHMRVTRFKSLWVSVKTYICELHVSSLYEFLA